MNTKESQLHNHHSLVLCPITSRGNKATGLPHGLV